MYHVCMLVTLMSHVHVCMLLYEEVDLKRYWIKIAKNQIYLASPTPVHYNLIIFNSGNRLRQKRKYA
jgi:hypothetical protein